MRKFAYEVPQSLSEATQILRHWGPEARALAGGTDLLVQIKEGGWVPACLVSLRRLDELKGIRPGEDGLWIGARTTMAELTAASALRPYAALREGAGIIGSAQIRNVATIGGNLCNAAPSADTAPGLIVLGAEAIIADGGQRTVKVEDLFVGPGQTILQPGELLTGLRIPALPPRSGSAYLRHTPRAWMDIAVVGVASYIQLDEAGRCVDVRIALGAVAPTPIRAPQAEAILRGEVPTDQAIEAAAQQAMKEARPISDVRGSADYRRHLVSVLTRRTLQMALARAQANQ
ncbi:MAG TPA: xanthine dehydrogenase family protein subunit M [Caldilineae bacterium]|nr:xanthine dehydrogenase family protein subunit M [Caldilineae bacterium]